VRPQPATPQSEAVTPYGLGQLAGKGKIPFDVHADGTRLFRREQLTTVANARDARKGLL